MKIYVVTYGDGDEWWTSLGVFSSLDKAIAFIDDVLKEVISCDPNNYIIEEKILKDYKEWKTFVKLKHNLEEYTFGFDLTNGYTCYEITAYKLDNPYYNEM
jgi:uncharacterized protein YktA (UPF0223 family)